jgi:hypothetical protein
MCVIWGSDPAIPHAVCGCTVNRSAQPSARCRIVYVIFHGKNMAFSGQDVSPIADM